MGTTKITKDRLPQLTKNDVDLSNVDNTSDVNKPISTTVQTALDLKQNALVSGVSIKTFNSQSLLGSGNIAYKNEAGQVKVNYTGLSVTGYTANTYKQYDIGAATPTIVASPTTKYPNSLPNNYTGVFDSARNGGSTTFAGRIIENPIPGQSVRYRIRFTYSGKNTLLADTQIFFVRLRNPVSGFFLVAPITLAPNAASGEFTVDFTTIADTASIPSPNGYILEGAFLITDNNLTTNITDITWFYNAIEP